MDRKEFLLYIGLLFLAITGIPGVLKTIASFTLGSQKNGFGGGPYGK